MKPVPDENKMMPAPPENKAIAVGDRVLVTASVLSVSGSGVTIRVGTQDIVVHRDHVKHCPCGTGRERKDLVTKAPDVPHKIPNPFE